MILAIDTATRNMSVALATETETLAEQTWQSENNHTMELAPAVADLLAKAGVTAKALTAIAVVVGPGSFTGVRIGLGFAKGLALACDLPVIGVRTLDVTVRSLPVEANHAVAVAQAGRSRVIWAVYQVEAGQWQAASDGVVGTWETVADLAQAQAATIVGEVDEAGAKILTTRAVTIATSEQNVRRAGRLAAMGWEQWRTGAAMAADLIQPLYAQQPTSGTV